MNHEAVTTPLGKLYQKFSGSLGDLKKLTSFSGFQLGHFILGRRGNPRWCPPRALQLRAPALEHERLANHLGDLGALGNDAGFAFGLTQFSALKEDLLRVNSALFGARYLLDYVVPGGVASDLPTVFADPLSALDSMLEQRVTEMRSMYDNHAGIQDRFRETGRLDTELARRLGALGLARPRIRHRQRPARRSSLATVHATSDANCYATLW